MKITCTPRPLQSARRGMVTVEFALASNILFLFVLAMLEFSRAYEVRHAVQQATYEGARVGVTPGATVDSVRARAQAILNVVGVDNPTIVVQPAVIDSSTLQVSVTISCQFSDNSWFTPIFFGGKVIDATSTLQHENALFAASGT